MRGARKAELASIGSGDSTWRYLLWVGSIGLLLVAGYLGFAVGWAPYSRFQGLGHFTYHDGGFTQLALPLTLARFYILRGTILATVGLGLVLLVGLRQKKLFWARLTTELQQASYRLLRRWQRLPAAAQLVVLGLVATLVAVRSWYLWHYPLGTDEVASYDFFVREGLLAISSFYPIPNNHIFFNLLASPLASAGLSPRLVMRLPTLLLGTVGTVGSYALLARLTGLRLATLITGLVGLMPLWVYYAAAGRGYFVQFCLLQAGFFAGLELLRTTSPYRYSGWLVFIGSSVLGLYTIPTYAYPLVSLLVGIGWCWLGQRRWQQLGQLALATTIIGLLVLLLYAPVLAVSGPEALVSNRYVATKTAAEFWPPYRAILYETAAALFGPSLRVSGPAWLAAALLGSAAVRRWVPAGPARQLGYVATAMVAMPLLLMAAQRVYAPVRTILYVSFFGYLLAGLLLARVPMRRLMPNRLRWPLLVLMVLGVGSFRLYGNQAQVRASRHETQQLEQAYQWLRSQPMPGNRPTQLWMNAQLQELFFAHYEQQNGSHQLLMHSDSRKGPTKRYDFAVLDNYFLAKDTVVHASYHQVYHDDFVTIFAPNSTGNPVR
jgi:hypothetical protein